MFKRNNNTLEYEDISTSAAKWWTDELKKPYSRKVRGNISLKIERKNHLSDEQMAIFEESLQGQLESRFYTSIGGFLRINSGNDISLKAAAHLAEIPDFPEAYFPSDVIMYVEEADKIFVHENGQRYFSQIR